MDFTVGIVSRNLATTSDFVKFRDSWNFMFFEARRGVRDTWHVLGGPRGVTCQAEGESNMSLGVGSLMTHGIMPFGGNLS